MKLALLEFDLAAASDEWTPVTLADAAKNKSYSPTIDPATLIQRGRSDRMVAFIYYDGKLYAGEGFHETLIDREWKNQSLSDFYYGGAALNHSYGVVGRVGFDVELWGRRIPEIVTIRGAPAVTLIKRALAALAERGVRLKPDAFYSDAKELTTLGEWLGGARVHQANQAAQDPYAELRREIQAVGISVHVGRDAAGRPIDRRRAQAKLTGLQAKLRALQAGQSAEAAEHAARTAEAGAAAEPLPRSPKADRKEAYATQGLYHDLWRGTSEALERRLQRVLSGRET